MADGEGGGSVAVTGGGTTSAGSTPAATGTGAGTAIPQPTEQAGAGTGNGAAPAPWYQTIDADTTGWLHNKGWFGNDLSKADLAKGMPELLKSYRGQEAMNGKDKVVWPKNFGDTNDPAVKDIRSKMGVPADPNGYELMPMGADGKPDMQADRTFANAMAKAFHEEGIPKAAAIKLAGKYTEHARAVEAANAAQFEQKAEQDLATLKQELGDGWARHAAAAQHAMRALGLDAATGEKIEKAIGTKALVNLFAKAGLGMAEDRGAGGGGTGGFMTPEGAASRKQELMHDEAWRSKYFSGDSVAKAEWDKLEQIQASALARAS